MGLIVCCDGGEVTASYLVKNGIVPDRFVFTYGDIQKCLTYVNPDNDTLLIIVSGLTEWSTVTVFNICDLLENYKKANGKIFKYEILSNIPLNIKMDYVFYRDDLMSGSETRMTYTVGGFKETPIKTVKDKAITKYIGVRAKRVKFTPYVREVIGSVRNDVDPKRLRKDIFD